MASLLVRAPRDVAAARGPVVLQIFIEAPHTAPQQEMELLGLLAQPHASPRAPPQPQQRMPSSLLDYTSGTGALRCPLPAAEQPAGGAAVCALGRQRRAGGLMALSMQRRHGLWRAAPQMASPAVVRPRAMLPGTTGRRAEHWQQTRCLSTGQLASWRAGGPRVAPAEARRSAEYQEEGGVQSSKLGRPPVLPPASQSLHSGICALLSALQRPRRSAHRAAGTRAAAARQRAAPGLGQLRRRQAARPAAHAARVGGAPAPLLGHGSSTGRRDCRCQAARRPGLWAVLSAGLPAAP
jgi:hypothetical protein